jgi:hypothetical protein
MNLHKNRERTHGAINDPDTKEFTIIMMQEPYWSTYTKESPSHQSWIRYERTNKESTPIAVTYINKAHFKPAQITQVELLFTDVVALQVHLTDAWEPRTVVVNVYNPCDQSLIENLHKAIKRIHIDSSSIVILS